MIVLSRTERDEVEGLLRSVDGTPIVLQEFICINSFLSNISHNRYLSLHTYSVIAGSSVVCQNLRLGEKIERPRDIVGLGPATRLMSGSMRMMLRIRLLLNLIKIQKIHCKESALEDNSTETGGRVAPEPSEHGEVLLLGLRGRFRLLWSRSF